MANIPAKLNSGDDFRGGCVGRINAIIDYLTASRIVADNSTIRADYTAGGVILRGIPQPQRSGENLLFGNLAASGFTYSISGGTIHFLNSSIIVRRLWYNGSTSSRGIPSADYVSITGGDIAVNLNNMQSPEFAYILCVLSGVGNDTPTAEWFAASTLSKVSELTSYNYFFIAGEISRLNKSTQSAGWYNATYSYRALELGIPTIVVYDGD